MGNRLFRSMGNRLDPAFTPASGTITLLDVFEQITHVNALFSGALLTFSTPTTFRLAVHRSILTDPAPTCPPTLLSSAHLLLSAKTFHQHNTKVYVAMDSATNDRPVYTPLNNFLQIAFLSREITTVYENGANSSPSDAPHLPVSESETESERLRKLSKARADHAFDNTCPVCFDHAVDSVCNACGAGICSSCKAAWKEERAGCFVCQKTSERSDWTFETFTQDDLKEAVAGIEAKLSRGLRQAKEQAVQGVVEEDYIIVQNL